MVKGEPGFDTLDCIISPHEIQFCDNSKKQLVVSADSIEAGWPLEMQSVVFHMEAMSLENFIKLWKFDVGERLQYTIDERKLVVPEQYVAHLPILLGLIIDNMTEDGVFLYSIICYCIILYSIMS